MTSTTTTFATTIARAICSQAATARGGIARRQLRATRYRVGDFSTEHLAPDERGAAIVHGFDATFVEDKHLNDAIEDSANDVLRL
jgi:hypothetical protein